VISISRVVLQTENPPPAVEVADMRINAAATVITSARRWRPGARGRLSGGRSDVKVVADRVSLKYGRGVAGLPPASASGRSSRGTPAAAVVAASAVAGSGSRLGWRNTGVGGRLAAMSARLALDRVAPSVFHCFKRKVRCAAGRSSRILAEDFITKLFYNPHPILITIAEAGAIVVADQDPLYDPDGSVKGPQVGVNLC